MTKNDWQKEYERDQFIRRRNMVAAEMERALSYHTEQARGHLSEMSDAEFVSEILGDGYADRSRGI